MPATGGPGQHATPSAITAMPVTRPASMPVPASSSPNNSRPTKDGTNSNANPVTSSARAARMSTFFNIRWNPAHPSRGPEGQSYYSFAADYAVSSSKVSLLILPVNL